MVVYSSVYTEMNDGYYQYALISKGCYSVFILCDKITNVCYTIGGYNMNIVKNIHILNNNEELYNTFIREIGEVCIQDTDDEGNYFSDIDGLVSDNLISKYLTEDIKKKIKEICKYALIGQK